MGSLWACCIVCRHCPVAMSHTLMAPSQSALSRKWRKGSSTCTGPLCPPWAAVMVTCARRCRQPDSLSWTCLHHRSSAKFASHAQEAPSKTGLSPFPLMLCIIPWRPAMDAWPASTHFYR